MSELLRPLATGMRELLQGAGIPGVTIGLAPPTSPDRLVALSPYLLEYDAATGLQRVGMSINLRLPSTVGAGAIFDLQGQVFTELADLRDTTLGGVRVSVVEWRTSVELDADDKGRPQAAETYHITCVRTSRVRTLSQ